MLKRTPHLTLLLLAGMLVSASAQSYTPSPRPAAPLANSIVYTNTQYGFRFLLPRTWTGYTVVTDGTWGGTPIVNGEPQDRPGQQVKGPLLRIRNPQWTTADPHEDIPIMVLTRAQWAMVEHDSLITSAAPFPPSELGRNAKYVFALPPRYNYDYATGWEEVEKIIDTRPLHATPHFR